MAYDFSKFKAKNKDVEEWLKKELGTVRTGRANTAILDTVSVESYGEKMSINQVAAVTAEDARTIRIAPWDMTVVKAIEKGLTIASLGLSVVVDDKGIRVTFPELTTERRVEMVKVAKAKMEEAKVSLRKHRDEALKDVQVKEKAGGIGEDEIKRVKNEIQKMVDASNKLFEDMFGKKEKEIVG